MILWSLVYLNFVPLLRSFSTTYRGIITKSDLHLSAVTVEKVILTRYIILCDVNSFVDFLFSNYILRNV